MNAAHRARAAAILSDQGRRPLPEDDYAEVDPHPSVHALSGMSLVPATAWPQNPYVVAKKTTKGHRVSRPAIAADWL